MPDYLTLPADERREALAVAATASGRPIHLLEKDIWVVWTLQELFASTHGAHLTFKGGTSLSKAYDVIRRFSEDIDLTYDIRKIAGDLIKKTGADLPPSRSQAKRWTDEIRQRLRELVSEKIVPLLVASLRSKSLSARVSADEDKIFIEYEALATGYGYVSPAVRLEFGARSTGEPNEVRDVICDAAAHLPQVTFPRASPNVMRPERTFWEKATAIHVYCHQGEFRGDGRFSRHWFDVTRLDASGHVDSAIANTKLASDVADHKSRFFIEKDKAGAVIDYHKAVNGALLLVPTDDALKSFAEDYQKMVDDGLLLDDADPFDKLLEHCSTIQSKANNK